MNRTATLYDKLGVDPTADAPTLRAAYRTQAKRHHPDRAAGRFCGKTMAAVNEAWTILSNPDRRAAYDRTLVNIGAAPSFSVTTTTYVPDEPVFARSDAWVTGLRLQAVRHAREAVTSAAWALSLRRRGRPRGVYEAQLDAIVCHVMQDTVERVEIARAAGAASLDLGLAAALVGVRHLAMQVLADCRVVGISGPHQVLAELIDRTWDNLAHGVSHEVELALGGNPRLAKALSTL